MKKHFASILVFAAAMVFISFLGYRATVIQSVIDVQRATVIQSVIDVQMEALVICLIVAIFIVSIVILLVSEYHSEIADLHREIERAKIPTDLPFELNRTANGGIVFKWGDLRVVCKSSPDGLIMEIFLPGGGRFNYVQADEPEQNEPDILDE